MDNHEQNHDDEHALEPQSILDKVIFGRRLRAARIMAGYDRADEFAATSSGERQSGSTLKSP